jgi:hypothetical protein
MMIDRFFKPILRAKHYLDSKIRLTDISQQQHKQCNINSQNLIEGNAVTTATTHNIMWPKFRPGTFKRLNDFLCQQGGG